MGSVSVAGEVATVPSSAMVVHAITSLPFAQARPALPARVTADFAASFFADRCREPAAGAVPGANAVMMVAP